MQSPVEQHGPSPDQPASRGEAAPVVPATVPTVAAGVAADAAAAVARERAQETPRLDPALLVNRELSLIEFQWRVFEEARDPANPLLERVRFLAIVASNLDEFFMIRVAGLEQQVAAGVTEPSSDGLTPAQQLAEVHRQALQLTRAMGAYWQDELLPLLDAAGIQVRDHPQLDQRQVASARAYFDEMVMPVLTPLAFDPGRPFPHISNLSLNLAVLIEDEGVERFARVKVPDTLPRLVPIGRTGAPRTAAGAAHRHTFVWLEQLVAAHADRLFPGVRVKAVYPFHVTRDAEMELQEMEAADLLASVEHLVRERRFGAPAESAAPLELLDLTIADAKHRSRLRELTRLREVLADYFWFDNCYGSTDESWGRYFHAFTHAAAITRGR